MFICCLFLSAQLVLSKGSITGLFYLCETYYVSEFLVLLILMGNFFSFPLRKFAEYVHFIAAGFNYLLLVPSYLSIWHLRQIQAAPSLPSCVL